jgi:transporter family-2 protein
VTSGAAAATAFAATGGVAVGIQVGINAELGKRIGVIETVTLTAIGTIVVLVPILLLARRGIGGLSGLSETPPWLWVGGILGAIALSALVFPPQEIGSLATIAVFLAGQVAMGLVVDALGLFGVERAPITASRVTGVVLLAAGAALVLRR